MVIQKNLKVKTRSSIDFSRLFPPSLSFSLLDLFWIDFESFSYWYFEKRFEKKKGKEKFVIFLLFPRWFSRPYSPNYNSWLKIASHLEKWETCFCFSFLPSFPTRALNYRWSIFHPSHRKCRANFSAVRVKSGRSRNRCHFRSFNPMMPDYSNEYGTWIHSTDDIRDGEMEEMPTEVIDVSG